MSKRVTIDIELGIAGPFLCSGTAPASWGLDDTFDRDYLGRPCIDRSHIKGKLLEAFKELAGTGKCSLFDTADIERWLGKKGPMENGSLFFTDFRLKDEALEKQPTVKPAAESPAEAQAAAAPPPVLHRIRKDSARGVVDPGAMQVLEKAFPGGSDNAGKEKTYSWVGSVEAVVPHDKKAEKIEKALRAGLKWVCMLGAEKTIGFGRLMTVEASMKTEDIDLSHPQADDPSGQMTLHIRADEPLILGDVRIPESNYQETLDYITGNAIKGALAQAINTACCVRQPARTPIDDKNNEVKKAFPLLAKHFSGIRFTHAFPSSSGKRPLVTPFSVVRAGGNHYDVALKKDAFLPDNTLPAFQTDWKDADFPGNGWAAPRRFAKTRTAIEGETRRAEEDRLFTYQYVCPDTEDREKITWIGGVFLDGLGLDANGRKALKGELVRALGLLRHLGKRAGRVSAALQDGAPAPHACTITKVTDRVGPGTYAVITLQSDALMVDDGDLLKNQSAEELKKLYGEFWKGVLGSGCELYNFFAMQKLRGGFLRRRRGDFPYYYPYYLTEAGSVFVLKLEDQEKEKAKEKFDAWRAKGLDLPGWATQVYGREVWKKCPYVPENGFGEVTVEEITIPDGAAGEGGKAS